MPDNVNPLMPPDPQSAPGAGLALQPARGSRAAQAVQGMTVQHDFLRGLHDKIADQMSKATLISDGLGRLQRLGPMVTPEDVMEEASKLVAAGVEPKALAGVLANMPPQGGEGLAQWVIGHAATVTQAVQRLQPVMAQARHELGTSALRLLAAHHFNDQQAASIPMAGGAPAGGPNAD